MRCSHRLGYIPADSIVTALEPEADDQWRALVNGERYRFCANQEFGVCNWLVEAISQESFCLACRHNRIIPDMNVEANVQAWAKIEAAKHRLFYSLIRLKLPISNRVDAPDYGLTFLFQASVSPTGPKVMTGHDNGLITIALEEADDAERESRRVAMHEPYRTLLGHFRHEVGHYYWDRLVRDGGKLDAARQVFGDDSVDYEEALKRYYSHGAPPDWQQRFVSAYATAHPWEDFAETWAHYLHIVDTLEMAAGFGLRVDPKLDDTDRLDVAVDFDPYLARDVGQLLNTWLPLSVALNSVNRAMGQPDLYPFVLSPQTATKFGFIHGLIQRG